MRGNLFGMLSSHPLSSLLSLHHLDAADPIFPNMNRTPALEHLFKAVNVDTSRILQQTICYDRSSKLTASVSWGYAVQIYEGAKPLPDLLLVQRTFMPWRRGSKVDLNHFMLSMREYPRDPCKRPAVFFMDSVVSNKNDVESNYVKHVVGNCTRGNNMENMENIRVFSQKLELDVEEVSSHYFLYLKSMGVFRRCFWKFFHLLEPLCYISKRVEVKHSVCRLSVNSKTISNKNRLNQKHS